MSELVRLVQTEALLWAEPVKISQQAQSLRLSNLPAELFRRILTEVLPVFHERWQQRERPLLPKLAWAQARYTQVVSVGGISNSSENIFSLRHLRHIDPFPCYRWSMTWIIETG